MSIFDLPYQSFLQDNIFPRSLKSVGKISPISPFHVVYRGKKLINFSSSDYLGLSHHPELIARSQQYAAHFGVGSGASRLVTGNLTIYEEIETKLAKALGKPAALIFGNGYLANFSVLEALLDPKTLKHDPLVFCDRLSHNSMLAGIRSTKESYRYAHNNLDHLQKLLDKYEHLSRPKFILAESLYSMDGDQADLGALVKIAQQHQAFLYIDDAHAVGTRGQQGWGNCREFAEDIPLIMGTFSKALGSYGGYVGCSTPIREYLINKSKGLIYSTSLPPPVLGTLAAVIDLIPKLEQERHRLFKISTKVRHFLHRFNFQIGSSDTHIIPWIIGDAEKTRQISQYLEQQGILATPIQPPSVSRATSRIRFCLSAAHTDEDIDHLLNVLRETLNIIT